MQKILFFFVFLCASGISAISCNSSQQAEIAYSIYPTITAYSDSQIIVKIPKTGKLKLNYSNNVSFKCLTDSTIIFSTFKEGAAFIESKINNRTTRKDFKIEENKEYASFVKEYGNNALPSTSGKATAYAFYLNKYILSEGKELPSFTLNDFKNLPVNNESLKGKVSVINFWYWGCSACMYEIPMLNNMRKEFIKDTSIQFYSFFMDSVQYNKTHDTLLFEANHVRSTTPSPRFLPVNFTFRHVGNTKNLDSMIQIMAYPTTLIIDRKGIVRKQITGAGPMIAEDIKNAISFADKYIE